MNKLEEAIRTRNFIMSQMIAPVVYEMDGGLDEYEMSDMHYLDRRQVNLAHDIYSGFVGISQPEGRYGIIEGEILENISFLKGGEDRAVYIRLHRGLSKQEQIIWGWLSNARKLAFDRRVAKRDVTDVDDLVKQLESLKKVNDAIISFAEKKFDHLLINPFLTNLETVTEVEEVEHNSAPLQEL